MITKNGDMFDWLAYKECGDCLHTQEVMRANREKLDKFIFNSGENIIIPTVESSIANVPPWRK